jgi:hypothetical protein
MASVKGQVAPNCQASPGTGHCTGGTCVRTSSTSSRRRLPRRGRTPPPPLPLRRPAARARPESTNPQQSEDHRRTSALRRSPLGAPSRTTVLRQPPPRQGRPRSSLRDGASATLEPPAPTSGADSYEDEPAVRPSHLSSLVATRTNSRSASRETSTTSSGSGPSGRRPRARASCRRAW